MSIKDRNVKILCECCDGQWWKNVFCDINGNPLAIMQYQKKIWNDVLKFKKKDIINYLLQCSTVTESILMKLTEAKQVLMVSGTYKVGNISVTMSSSNKKEGENERKFYIMSNGGNIESEALMCKIATTPKKMNPPIWNQSTKSNNKEISREELMQFLPKDIIEDYDENCKSIQMDITQDTKAQASDSTKSDVSESNIIVEFLSEL